MRKPSRKYLDGEKLFHHYYVEMAGGGTFAKLRDWAVSVGMVNHRGNTTIYPTPMGVHKAAWRWASLKENKDKAWEWFQIFMENTGDYCSDDEWREFAIQKIKNAWQHPTEQKSHQFLEDNGWI